MKLIDVKQKEYKGVRFGTCEFCFYTDSYSENIYVFKTSKGVKKVSDVLLDYDSYDKHPSVNIIEFAEYVSKIEEPEEFEWFWLGDVIKNYLSRPIDNQKHYMTGKIEPLDIINEFGFGYSAGNVLKYLYRYKNKGGIEDLRKALTYLDNVVSWGVTVDVESDLGKEIRKGVLNGEYTRLFYESLTSNREELIEAIKEEIYEDSK